MIFNKATSLRVRYFTLTLLVAVVVFSVVIASFRETLLSRELFSAKQKTSHAAMALLADMEQKRFDVLKNIELFLVNPVLGASDVEFHRLVDSLHADISALQPLVPEDNIHINAQISDLKSKLQAFEESVSNLFESRIDVNRQYPGLSVAVKDMTAPQLEAGHRLQLLSGEIEDGSFEPENPQAYRLILKARLLWEKMVSQYRIYLANRFASFSTDILQQQASSLYQVNDELIQTLDQLTQIYRQEDSFEGLDNLEVAKHSVAQWMKTYGVVRTLHESENWRTDNQILENRIFPQLNQISILFQQLKGVIEGQEHLSQMGLEENFDRIFRLLVIIICLFLVFILGILFSLNSTLFKPIEHIAQTLKSRAFNLGNQGFDVKHNSREIGDLIDAFEEMNHKVNQRQKDLEYQALHDHLTTLPNRFLLNQRLEYLILTSARKEQQFSLLFMDINNFKDVNDSLGHSIGDKLLIQSAMRIQSVLRSSDTLSRLGGDEFAILLPEVTPQQAETVVKHIQEALAQPFQIDRHSINSSISIGIAHFPDNGEDCETLLQRADIAMYCAKKNRLDFAHYDSSSDESAENRLGLVQDLRDAIDHNQLELYFQPQFSCERERFYGVEALLRWNHPTRGFINPEKIIELAEYSNLIHDLTSWVINEAISHSGRWHQQNLPLQVSVNLSVRDLNNADLLQTIQSALLRHSVQPDKLKLEITESGMMDNPLSSIELLTRMKGIGLKLSVDDFGTGFSSLKYLKMLPVDELKIDKSFVLDMQTDDNDRIIVQSTISLGHSLGLSVVAEGIESLAVLSMLQSMECDGAQGYYFSKPLKAEQLVDFFRQREAG